MAGSALVPGSNGAVVTTDGDPRAFGDFQKPFQDDPAQASAHRILAMVPYSAQIQVSAAAELLRQHHPAISDSLVIELANAGITKPLSVSARDIADFQIEFGEAGKACIAYWGGGGSGNDRDRNIRTRLGTLNARLSRILGPLTEDERRIGLNWLDSLPPGALVAVLLELST